MTCSEDAHVIAAVHMPCFADDEFFTCRTKNRHLRTAKAQIDGAMMVCDGKCRGFRLVEVTWIDYRHVGQHRHHADVFKNLVGRAVFTEGKPCVRSTDLYIFIAVGNALTNLIVHPSGREVGKGSRKRDIAANGKAGRNAHHVGFGNSHLKKSLGKGFLKRVHLKRADKIGA